jgi:hypothetical protein
MRGAPKAAKRVHKGRFVCSASALAALASSTLSLSMSGALPPVPGPALAGPHLGGRGAVGCRFIPMRPHAAHANANPMLTPC